MARRAARGEGLFSGPVDGRQPRRRPDVARRLGPGRRVVTIQVDSGLKYLTGRCSWETRRAFDVATPADR